MLYRNGLGVDRNFKKAIYWFTKSANQGNNYAQYNLGIMYEYGQGVDQNTELAKYWYSLAAKSGDKNALEILKKFEC